MRSLECVLNDKVEFYEKFHILQFLILWTFLYSSPNSVTQHSVEITEFYCHATVFSQIFRQINVLQKDFTINQFDEKKLRGGSEFLVFPQCVTQIS